MTKILIGHRGTGKTTFLKKLLKEDPNLLGFDLDEEIEKNSSIERFFLNSKEEDFRKKEKEMFQKLMLKKPDIISLGAGFDLNLLNSECEVIWLRRESDQQLRIFLDRPRLKPESSMLEESRSLFLERHSKYKQKAHRVCTLPEGDNGFKASDFFHPKDFSSVSITLLGQKNIQTFLKDNFKLFEIRNDFFKKCHKESLKNLILSIPQTKRLLSFRSQDHFDLFASEKGTKDWALDLGPADSFLDIDILSLHQSPSVEEAVETLSKANSRNNQHLKLAVEVEDFKELQRGHKWQSSDPKRRSFLPRSRSGRWRWYRTLMQEKQKLNFFRESESDFLDQPFFFEVFKEAESSYSHFAAILGNPINHSLTPSEQKNFFGNLNQPVVAIAMKESEATYETFDFLKFLGLNACAVTSPLKKKVCQLFSSNKKNHSYNTLFFGKRQTLGVNTDREGFKWIAQNLPNTQEIVLWGGEGVIGPFKSVFPQGLTYSSRRGEPKKNSPFAKNPEVLIWAAPSHKPFQKPPQSWKLKTIFDLSYKDNSFAKELSFHMKIRYISGHKFFKAQAAEQRRFWTENFKSDVIDHNLI